MTNQQKYEYIATSWGKEPIEVIARKTRLEIPYIHIMVMRMRKKGVPIPRLSRSPCRSSDRGKGIDYQKIINLLTNQNI